jgi:hypothetical protein
LDHRRELPAQKEVGALSSWTASAGSHDSALREGGVCLPEVMGAEIAVACYSGVQKYEYMY